MAVVVIPLVPSVPFYRQRVALSGVFFTLDLRWSMREEAWYLDIRSGTTDEPIITHVKLTPNLPLLYRYRTVDGVPNGELMLVDARQFPEDPTFTELGAQPQLVFAPADDLTSMLSEASA